MLRRLIWQGWWLLCKGYLKSVVYCVTVSVQTIVWLLICWFYLMLRIYIYIYICYSCTCVGADVGAREPNLPHKCPMVLGFSRPNSQWRIIVRAPDWTSSAIPRRGSDLAGSAVYKTWTTHEPERQRTDSSKITNEVEDIFWVKKWNLIKLKWKEYPTRQCTTTGFTQVIIISFNQQSCITNKVYQEHKLFMSR
jgi:hypothetical protein